MTFYLMEPDEPKKPKYSLPEILGWNRMVKKYLRGVVGMKPSNAIFKLANEIDMLKKENELNKQLASEYKAKYEELLACKKTSPEGEEREVLSEDYYKVGGTI